VFALKSGLRVGLDIGSHAIKLVATEKGGHGKVKLVQALSRDLYTGQDKYDPDGPKKAQVVPLLLEMFQELGVRPKRIVHLASCIGGLNQAAKEIRTIQLSDDEMASSILQEARKHVPLDGSESVVDYQIVGEDPKEADKVRVLVAATTKRMFDAHVDMLREAELKPGIVDLEPLAAANSYLGHIELPDDGVVVFLNVGARRTNLLLLSRKEMFFSRDLPVGGFNFTEEIMKKLNVKFDEAEQVKKTEGVSIKPVKSAEPVSGYEGLALAEKTALERLGDEVNRSLRYYVKETGQSFFTHMEIVGGMAECHDVTDYLASKFSIEVRSYDPFTFMEGVRDVRHRPLYAAAAGLAARVTAL
jgi:type IV pilus assembly protein PilM